jgi:hypothetical protein
MVAALSREVPKCGPCRGPGAEFYRARYGCDEPAAESVFSIGCGRCGGSDANCPDCSGSGLVPIHRCPNEAIKELDPRACATASTVCHLYMGAKAFNWAPVEGAMLDQAAGLLAAFRVLQEEEARIESEEFESRQRAQAGDSGLAKAKALQEQLKDRKRGTSA